MKYNFKLYDAIISEGIIIPQCNIDEHVYPDYSGIKFEKKR